MKIVTYEYDQDVQVGVISDDGKFVYPANKYSNMYELIQESDFEELLSINRMALGGVPLDQVKILAPPDPFPQRYHLPGHQLQVPR